MKYSIAPPFLSFCVISLQHFFCQVVSYQSKKTDGVIIESMVFSAEMNRKFNHPVQMIKVTATNYFNY